MAVSEQGHRWRPAIGLLAAMALYGCSCSNDPREGGYLCGRSNIDSGVYQAQVDAKRTTVEDTKDDTLKKRQDQQDLTMKNQDLESQIDQVSQGLNKLDTETAELNKKIATALTSNTANKKELEQLQKQTQQLQMQTALAKNTPGTTAERQQKLEDLQKRYDALQKQILLLTGGA
jgi:chromosome segregation ATPase